MAWYQARKQREREADPLYEHPQRGGRNRILSEEEDLAIIKFAEQCAARNNEGEGGEEGARSTRQMVFDAIFAIRNGQGKKPPSRRWFQKWLQENPEMWKICAILGNKKGGEENLEERSTRTGPSPRGTSSGRQVLSALVEF